MMQATDEADRGHSGRLGGRDAGDTVFDHDGHGRLGAQRQRRMQEEIRGRLALGDEF